MQLEVKVNNKEIYLNDEGAVCLRISTAENNGVYFENGILHAKQGKEGGSTGQGGTQNLPGNAIDGQENKGISILRCNASVSRLKRVDNDIKAPQILDIVNNILSS